MRLIPALCSIPLVLLLVACSPIEEKRGHVMDEMALKQVVIGMSSQDDIRAILGSPSTVSDFGNPRWYYIRSTSEQTAFLRPDIVERAITRIDFDGAGIVQKIDSYTLQDGQKVADVEEFTPTEGRGLSFFEQMLGNLGRFNAPAGGR